MTLTQSTNALDHILNPNYLYVYGQSIVFFRDCTEIIGSRKESESYILFHLKKIPFQLGRYLTYYISDELFFSL